MPRRAALVCYFGEKFRLVSTRKITSGETLGEFFFQPRRLRFAELPSFGAARVKLATRWRLEEIANCPWNRFQETMAQLGPWNRLEQGDGVGVLRARE